MNLRSDFIPFFKKVTCKDEEIKNPGNNHGLTPFHIVCQKGHLDIAKMLVQNFTELKVNFNCCICFHNEITTFNDSDNDGHTGFHLGTIQILCKHVFGVNNPPNHFNPLLLRSWGQVGYQMKQKSSRNSIFLVSATNFQLELNNLQKRPKYVSKCHFWEGFLKFIQL